MKSIVKSLRKFRKDKYGDRYIYGLRHPVPKGVHPALDRFVETRNMVELDGEPMADKEYYAKVTPEEYWKADIDPKMLFKNIKHPGLLFPEGRVRTSA